MTHKFYEWRDGYVYPLKENKNGSFKCLVLDLGLGHKKPVLKNIPAADVGVFYQNKDMTDAAIVEIFMDHPRFELRSEAEDKAHWERVSHLVGEDLTKE